MKIGILTFHASHNYGSMLQAYALQQYLKMLGHEPEFINLRNDKQKRLYQYPIFPPLRHKKRYILSLLNPFWMHREIRKWKKYESFMCEKLSLTDREYHSWTEIMHDIPLLKYDIIVTGGDQIWNMRSSDFDTSYFLPSKLDGIKKVSYSPSFGGTFLSKITPSEGLFIKEKLSDYAALSVREQSMQEYLSKSIKKDIEVVVDPTFLLDATDYHPIMDEKPIVEGNYIFYYSPFERPHAERLAHLLGKHYGMKVFTSLPHPFCNKGIKSVQVSGPSEFLNLLRNATLVVGKSFHLVVFSLMFHKNFIAVDGKKDARLMHILNQIGIEERGEVDETNYKTVVLPKIDFLKSDRLLKELRLTSEEYLKTNLK